MFLVVDIVNLSFLIVLLLSYVCKFLDQCLSHVSVKALMSVSLCVSDSVEAPGRASYHKYHIQQGWCLGSKLGCLLGLGIAGVWAHRLLTDTRDTNGGNGKGRRDKQSLDTVKKASVK